MFMLVHSEAQTDLPNQQDFFVLPLNQTMPGYKIMQTHSFNFLESFRCVKQSKFIVAL